MEQQESVEKSIKNRSREEDKKEDRLETDTYKLRPIQRYFLKEI